MAAPRAPRVCGGCAQRLCCTAVPASPADGGGSKQSGGRKEGRRRTEKKKNGEEEEEEKEEEEEGDVARTFRCHLCPCLSLSVTCISLSSLFNQLARLPSLPKLSVVQQRNLFALFTLFPLCFPFSLSRSFSSIAMVVDERHRLNSFTPSFLFFLSFPLIVCRTHRLHPSVSLCLPYFFDGRPQDHQLPSLNLSCFCSSFVHCLSFFLPFFSFDCLSHASFASQCQSLFALFF